MPKGFVETDHVNKDVFMQVLKLKKTSIRRLDEELSIECSDKTIRRSLNNGKMRRQYIEQIAKYLDVDSRLLTGELVEGAFHTTNSVIRELYLNPLTHIEDFPYFREEQERLQREKIDERRSEPSSRATLMGEQPNPWDLLQPQDVTSRHRGAKPLRRYELLGGISLLSPEYLLSFERCPFHAETPDHYALVSYLIDLYVSQSSALMPLHSADGYQSS